MTKGKDLVARGPDDLMPPQREYLQKYAETGSESEAREALDLSNRRVARWHREDEAFRAAFSTIVDGVHEGVAQRLKAVEEELPDAIKRLMSASKPIKVTCPYDEKHKFEITVDHPSVQAKMVEMMMKARGHLKDVRRLEMGADEELSSALALALSMFKKGKQISEQSRLALIQSGHIEDEAVEGEFREVTEEE